MSGLPQVVLTRVRGFSSESIICLWCWSAIIGHFGSISGSAPPSWWSCDYVAQRATMVHVKKFQWIGDSTPKNNMFGDWSAIIGTVGSIFGSAPPSWWSCDHVSPKGPLWSMWENANYLGISPRTIICSGIGGTQWFKWNKFILLGNIPPKNKNCALSVQLSVYIGNTLFCYSVWFSMSSD